MPQTWMNFSPVPIHHVPESTTKKRDPGLLGSPKSTARSLVPAAFRTHLIWAGVFQSTASLTGRLLESVGTGSVK